MKEYNTRRGRFRLIIITFVNTETILAGEQSRNRPPTSIQILIKDAESGLSTRFASA